MPTRQLFLFFILIFLTLPTLRAAVPLQPVATATTISLDQSPPIEPIIKKTKKIKKRPNQKNVSEKFADWTFVVSTLLIIGGAVILVLALVAVLPWAWVLWSSLAIISLAIIAAIIVLSAQNWAALLSFVMLPLHLFIFGFSLLIGGLIANILWAWIVGAVLLLLIFSIIPIYRKIL